MTINGLILVGGHSHRMGTDKSVLSYHGRPQRAYLYELLGQFCSNVYLSCRSDQVAELSHYQTITDKYPNDGPMGALLSAFEYDAEAAWLVVACDMPFIDSKTIDFLLKNTDSQTFATAFINQKKQIEPLLSVWKSESYGIIERLHTKGQKSLSKVLEQHNAQLVIPPNYNWILNANTPESYQSFFQ
jgi:molybdenum cofactor guanylyltransferase